MFVAVSIFIMVVVVVESCLLFIVVTPLVAISHQCALQLVCFWGSWHHHALFTL